VTFGFKIRLKFANFNTFLKFVKKVVSTVFTSTMAFYRKLTCNNKNVMLSTGCTKQDRRRRIRENWTTPL